MGQTRIVRVGAIERTHRHQMHDVPAHLCPWGDRFGCSINEGIDLFLTGVPETLPRQGSLDTPKDPLE